MTLNEKQKSILESAQRYFDEGDYSKTLPLLNALLSQKVLSADVHHMLGSLHYERGEFKNSILNFQKALEVDPYFTDSSIGLSVVLNDLGKYEQGKLVFEQAQARLKQKNSNTKDNTSLNALIAQKHKELSELYTQANRPKLAFQNLVQFEELAEESLETVLEKARLQRMLSNFNFATEILKSWWLEDQNPVNTKFFIELTELYYLDRQALSALSTCEHALKLDPSNSELKNLYKNLTQTSFDLKQAET